MRNKNKSKIASFSHAPLPRLNFTPYLLTPLPPCQWWGRGWELWSVCSHSSLLLLPLIQPVLFQERSPVEYLQPLPLLMVESPAAPHLPTPWHQHPIQSFSSKSWCHFIFILWNSMIQFCVLKWCFTPSVLILRTPSWHVRNRRGLARVLTPVCFTPCSLLPFLLFQLQFSPLWQLSTVLHAL